MEVEEFTRNIVGVIIALIIVGLVALPVISDITGSMSAEDDKVLITIIDVIPIFLILVVLISVTYMLYNRHKN